MRYQRAIASVFCTVILAVLAAVLTPSISFAHDHGHHGAHGAAGSAGGEDSRSAASAVSATIAQGVELPVAPEVKRPTRQTKMMSGMHRHCSDCPDEPVFESAAMPKRGEGDVGLSSTKTLLIYSVSLLDRINEQPGASTTKPPWQLPVSTSPKHLLITSARLRI